MKYESQCDFHKVDVLLPYQKKWMEDSSDVKVIEKSRRVGISWVEAADSVIFAASRSGHHVWYIGYNQEMAREFINDCANWARHFNEAASEMEQTVFADEDKDIIAFRVSFSSGHRVTALSSRPTNLRGKQGRVVIDEAAFHPDLEELVKAAMALIMWGGEVRIISTHYGEDNAFNELIKDCRSGRKPYSLHRVTLDDALRDGLYKRICTVKEKIWSSDGESAWRQMLIDNYGDSADEELFCVPSRGSGFYFSNLLVEQCMEPGLPVLRWECASEFASVPEDEREAKTGLWISDCVDPLLEALDPNLLHYFGEDFGRSGDLTVITPLAELPDLTYAMPFIVELRNVPFKEQERILFHLVDRLPRFRSGAMDARGNGQYLAEVAMQRYGTSRINQVMLSTEWYREAMPKYKAALEDRAIAMPRHSDVLRDHRIFRMESGVARIPDGARMKGTDGGQRHGDFVIAAALAWNARRTGSAQVEYRKVTGRTTKMVMKSRGAF